MSTAVIFSGCTDKKQAEKRPQVKEVRIGVTTDLMSFDPFSFQSLGEAAIRDLLYEKVFQITNEGIESKYLKNIKVRKGKMLYSRLSKEVFNKLNRVFLKGQTSVLWKDTFKQFTFSRESLVYKAKKDFISQLKTLESIFLIEEDGGYKVEEHIKGSKLKLIDKDKRRKISILRVKDNQTGLDLIQARELDVYFPGRLFAKGLLEKYKDIKIVDSKEEKLKFRMYHKYQETAPLASSFCNNRKEILKIIGSSWKLEKDLCGQNKNPNKKPSNKFRVLYSDRYGMKVLDFLYNQVKVNTGLSFVYDNLKSMELTNALKMGQFEQHLSLEKTSNRTLILYDSFHTKGRYNTYKLSSKKLDLLLEESSEQLTIKDFYKNQEVLRRALTEILPLTFSYTRPAIDYIKRRDSKVLRPKSSKRLIFLKE